MYEERAAKLAELNYVRKVEAEKQSNAATLAQWRAQMSQ